MKESKAHYSHASDEIIPQLLEANDLYGYFCSNSASGGSASLSSSSPLLSVSFLSSTANGNLH